MSEFDDKVTLIKEFKTLLIECTNIEDSPDEMRVIDTILFRFYKLGWLQILASVYESASEKFIDKILNGEDTEKPNGIFKTHQIGG